MPAGSPHLIPFLPFECRLSQVYGPRSQSGIVVKEGRESRWSSCARVLEGHTSYCRCVAFSPDGGQLCLAPTITPFAMEYADWRTFAGHEGPPQRVISVAYSNGWDIRCFGIIGQYCQDLNAVTGLQVGEYYWALGSGSVRRILADGLRIASACYMKSMCGLLVPPTSLQWYSKHLVMCSGWHFSCLTGFAVASEDGSIRIWVGIWLLHRAT